jgi:hypothetical protein
MIANEFPDIVRAVCRYPAIAVLHVVKWLSPVEQLLVTIFAVTKVKNTKSCCGAPDYTNQRDRNSEKPRNIIEDLVEWQSFSTFPKTPNV